MDQQIKDHFPFPELRPGQAENIKRIIIGMRDYKKANFIAEYPTGTGKSPIAWTVGKCLHSKDVTSTRGHKQITKPNILILTSSRQLQKQYSDSFADKGIEYLWSAKNYECINPHMHPEDEVTYGSSGCLKRNCPNNKDCPYLVQKRKFKMAEIGVMNYHYFLSSCEFNPNILICDEAHNLPGLLCDIHSLKLSEFGYTRLCSQIEKASHELKINPSSFINPLKLLSREKVEDLEGGLLRSYCESVGEEFRGIQSSLDDEFKVIDNEMQECFEEKTQPPNDILKEWLRKGRALDSLHNLLERLDGYTKSNVKWVVSELETKQTKITAKPLEVVEGMEKVIARCNQILYLSATICGPFQFAKELGLDFSTCDYSSTKCPFPIESRKVYTLNTGSLNYKNKAEMLPKFVEKIDWVIDGVTQNWTKVYSGIIHSISYDNADFIKKYSKHKDKIFVPTREDLMNLNKIIEKEKEGMVIVSPSILEGVDLFDDLSRFQIFLKVPYGFLGDRWINTKMKLDPEWYSREAVIKIVQGCGRSIRSSDDWAWTFILDSNFGRLLNQSKGLFPEWFREAIFNLG